MSLIDVDKTSDNRLTPLPNNDDDVTGRMSHNTMGNTYRSTQSNDQRIVFKQGLIITYDQNNRASSVFGYVPEVSNIPIFVIAKEGNDVFVDILGIDAPEV